MYGVDGCRIFYMIGGVYDLGKYRGVGTGTGAGKCETKGVYLLRVQGTVARRFYHFFPVNE